MFLADALEALIETLQDDLAALAGAEDAAEQAEALEQIATRCTQVGLATVLVDANPALYRRQLTYSGYARRWFLNAVAPELPGAPYSARSRWPSFYAALAAGELDLARTIGHAEPATIVVDGEYAQEFRVSLAIAELLMGNSQPSTRAAVAEDEPTLGAVLDALAARDVEVAQVSLVAFLADEGERAQGAPDSADPIEDELTRRLSLRGLALVQLARALGLPLAAPDHERCPVIATELPATPRADDIIAEVREPA